MAAGRAERFTSVKMSQNRPWAEVRHGAQTPQESGSPIRFSWLARVSWRVRRRQGTRSREGWICTPGNHSKVEVAMEESSLTRTIEGRG